MKHRYLEEMADQVEFGEMDNRFFLIGLLNEFMNRFQAAGDQFFGEISWKQCFTLICLRLFKEPPALKDLSLLMGSSHQNVKQLLIKLEKAEFVKMEPDELDRRKQRIFLTEKAADFFEHYDGPSNGFIDQLFGEVDDEMLETTIYAILRLDSQLQKL